MASVGDFDTIDMIEQCSCPTKLCESPEASTAKLGSSKCVIDLSFITTYLLERCTFTISLRPPKPSIPSVIIQNLRFPDSGCQISSIPAPIRT